MTQNEKDILLKDLCSRLPYGVKGEKYTIRMDGEFVPLIDVEIIIAEDIITLNGCPGYTIKPYLFPLSSMTDDQKQELNRLSEKECKIIEDVVNNPTPSNVGFPVVVHYMVDWCNKNHFDYRGLIPIGLAIDATGLNIY